MLGTCRGWSSGEESSGRWPEFCVSGHCWLLSHLACDLRPGKACFLSFILFMESCKLPLYTNILTDVGFHLATSQGWATFPSAWLAASAQALLASMTVGFPCSSLAHVLRCSMSGTFCSVVWEYSWSATSTWLLIAGMLLITSGWVETCVHQWKWIFTLCLDIV